MDELNAHPKLWQYAVVFGAQSWKIITSPEKITNFQRPASKRDERPAFGEIKTDTYIPDVATPFKPKKGKVAWVLNPGRKKGEIIAIKAKVDHVDSEGVWLVGFPGYKNAWLYNLKDVFNTKAEAERETKSF